MEYLEPDIFLSQADQTPIVDVRSPGEYRKAHIGGAINLSLFSDKEREDIGILYSQEGQRAAFDRGLKFVTPKLESFEKKAHELAQNKRLLVHCWRGGMRSEKMALFFEETGLSCGVLKGGYKAYRKKLREDFANIKTLHVLEGPTGSGKTEILQEMAALGEQFLDLEKYANHRGSTFGWIGKGEQPSTGQFQNNIHLALLRMDPEKPIWVEGESLKIGKVSLPEALWNKMNEVPVFNIDLDVDFRVRRIVDEYGCFSKQELFLSLAKIRSRLGDLNYRDVRRFIENDKLESAVIILLKYYDKAYYHSLKTNRKMKPLEINLSSENVSENAAKIIAASRRITNAR